MKRITIYRPEYNQPLAQALEAIGIDTVTITHESAIELTIIDEHRAFITYETQRRIDPGEKLEDLTIALARTKERQ